MGNVEKAAADIGANARAIQLDVILQATITADVVLIEKQYGHLDLLVNNAGISHAGRPGRTLEETTLDGRASTASLDKIRTVWETNVLGVIAVTQSALPLLLKSTSARIVMYPVLCALLPGSLIRPVEQKSILASFTQLPKRPLTLLRWPLPWNWKKKISMSTP